MSRAEASSAADGSARATEQAKKRMSPVEAGAVQARWGIVFVYPTTLPGTTAAVLAGADPREAWQSRARERRSICLPHYVTRAPPEGHGARRSRLPAGSRRSDREGSRPGQRRGGLDAGDKS